MTFNTTFENSNDIAKINLSGELDANSAPIFKMAVEKAAAKQPKHLVLMMQDLEYMASAGLRVLIFAKQKMGSHTDIYMVSPQEMVLETLKKTGFDRSVIVVDKYEAA